MRRGEKTSAKAKMKQQRRKNSADVGVDDDGKDNCWGNHDKKKPVCLCIESAATAAAAGKSAKSRCDDVP